MRNALFILIPLILSFSCNRSDRPGDRRGDLPAPAFLVAMQDGEQSHDSYPSSDWRAVLEEDLHLLGHRNWILVVDKAFPQ